MHDDPRHSCTSASSRLVGRAAGNVLAQQPFQPLLSLILSFQHGLPIVTGPLIYRYLKAVSSRDIPAAFPVSVTSVSDMCMDPSNRHPLAPPLGQRETSKRKWRERVTAEAIAALDTETLGVLRFQIELCMLQSNPEQAHRRCVHRAWEAAAAFGRVDMLAYLVKSHTSTLDSFPLLPRFAARWSSTFSHTRAGCYRPRR